MLELLFYLIAVHFVTDFALQSRWMADYKSPEAMPAEFAGHKDWHFWVHVLTAHSFVNGLGVALVTGVWWLGLCEVICHWLIDYSKCIHKIDVNKDQLCHFLSKVVWCIVAKGVL